jgi:tRNA(Ile)-lysidine synthase
VSAADAAAPVSATEASALFADLENSGTLVLAISGGPDSTAMMVLAARWSAALERGPRLVAVTVDHGLRPGAAAEARDVAQLAVALGIAHQTVRWSGEKPSSGIQEAAREQRYRLLAAAARREGARHILVAHTRDDQAETVVFRLARGSGLTGLGGMTRLTPRDDLIVVRPLLEVPKARLVATLKAGGVAYAEDPSNVDARFARTRLRRLMPALSAEGLDAGRLGRLAWRLARADRALEAATDEAFPRVSLTRAAAQARILLDIHAFSALPAEIALRVLGRAISAAGAEGPVELGKLEALLAAIAAARAGGGRQLRWTLAGAMITLEHHGLVVERAPPRRAAAARRRRASVKGPVTR